ncbi:MAG: tetratricopeptide repeat protein, partial [Candidatus Obscuribacterales bacterium]|nr:tetratricopeptide repeat protein [Candidatus Obscuribacterales bacterium]
MKGKQANVIRSVIYFAIYLFTSQCSVDGQIAKPTGARNNPYKLKATFSDSSGKPLLDAPYHYEAEQGVECYAKGNLEEAEKHFQTAAMLSEGNAKVGSESRATLQCNLGAVLRDERKYEEAKKHFEIAVEIARKNLRERQPVLDYIAAQYSA